ncbi:MAG: tRNA (N6-isopentenyl adenosine(37)-C2)-methylthiotransferase MiaB [Candidatus Pelagibacter sp.]|nr:tRNA (N6-isopentenyl adenosine(37)-C2)-methylthiotransferase MiaB [Candidatus Pelagibacter sp.]OUV86920.1 MAG: tRNA (N6-isopentenyl adenosine(37)-C2)-methylthiotransferase MiaB [Pelagibacteraceae bacterium TMED136]|tara:strand:- start:32047 stop:33354 length:1308 start_codon:yes stop_codon:yes gene_type:complete
MNSRKFYIKTFGCQMNEYDSNKISDLLKSISFDKTEKIDDADCIVFNTCHIREKATQKVYSDIGKNKKIFKNKSKPIFVLAGCVAQAESSVVFEKSDYVDIVVGPQAYHKLPNLIEKFKKNKKRSVDTNLNVDEKFDVLNSLKNNLSKVSSFVTVQEGCDKFCKFCVVPYTRGPEFSRNHKTIINEIKSLTENGTKEIILLGQNVSAYKDENVTLAKLIKKIANINEVQRIRFTTSHPNDFDDELISLFGEEPKLMPQLHLPVQSGSDKVLKLMNRNHTRDDYLKLIDRFRLTRPDIQFSSDFIVGYPGETHEDHKDTINLIKDVGFSLSYSFIYSQRPGTPATNLDEISIEITKKRLEEVQGILFKQQLEFNNYMVNKENNVLFENKTQDQEQFFGRNQYMVPVFVKNNLIKAGEIKKIFIQNANRNNLFGKIV